MEICKGLNIRYCFFVFAFLNILGLNSYAQNNANLVDQNLGSEFVKKRMLQKSGELCFNILRIYNYSEDTTVIKPILNIPDKWAIFSTSFVETKILPHDTISLPFSIRIPSVAPAVIDHKIIFQAFSSKNTLVLEDSFFIQAKPNHNWDVKIPDKRFFFYPRQNEADFEIVIENNGNIPETIHLEVRPDKKLILETTRTLFPEMEITIPANTDTTLYYTVSYNHDKERIFDITKVQITASNAEKSVYRAIIIEKYDDTYAPLHVDKNLPHEFETGLRTFTNNRETLPYVNARGLADFKDKGAFKYSFTYHDLTETENIIGNTYYQFLYARNSLNVGLGAFSSRLGRNLYSRNCIMLSNQIELGESNTLTGYGSMGYVEPKTSIAIGNDYVKNDFKMHTAAAYDIDIENKVNTGSFAHRFNRIKLHPKHTVSGAIYSYYEDHKTMNPYTLAGIAYDVQYSGLFGNRFAFQITNNYGSPDIPGPQMGLFSIDILSKFYMSERSNYLAIYYNNSKKEYFIRDAEGIKLPRINLEDQYAKLLYNSNTNNRFKWSFGPSVEYYYSVNPLVGLGQTKDFDLRKYRLEFRAMLGRYFRFSMKGGLSQESDEIVEGQYNDKYDFHFLGDYNNNGYGLRVSYDYGPMVNTGLYQYALDAGNNSVIVSPYLLKDYLNGLINVSLFTNFTHRIDLEYTTVNVNPRVETYVFKNWYFVFGGTYSFTRQVFNERPYQRSFFFMQFAVKKRWGSTKKSRKDRDLVRLKVLVYQDENGNGQRDDNEDGIPFVKTRILLRTTPDKEAREGLPIDITLLTNESGGATFNRIPTGNYDVFITPLSEMKEYFYVSRSVESVELLQNTLHEIPFQKARKITGQINVSRRKYIAEDEEKLDLKNIRITAYNQQGNSYSAFTDEQGRFVLFAPGGLSYYVRLANVFGSSFKILQNDIKVNLSDTTISTVIFTVTEANKKINIKKATKPKPGEDKKKIQKIKILSGEIYDASSTQRRADKNAVPDFEVEEGTDSDHVMVVGKFYVVLGQDQEREKAIKIMNIYREMGVNAYIGINDYNQQFYVFTNYFNTKQETRNELTRLKNLKVRNATVFEFEP